MELFNMKKELSKMLLCASLAVLMLTGCGGEKVNTAQTENSNGESVRLILYIDGDRQEEISSFQCQIYDGDKMVIEKDFAEEEIRENNCYIEIDKDIVPGANVIYAKYLIDEKYSFESGYPIDSGDLNVVISYFADEDCYGSVLAEGY